MQPDDEEFGMPISHSAGYFLDNPIQGGGNGCSAASASICFHSDS